MSEILRTVMTDAKLTIEAKAIFSYLFFCNDREKIQKTVRDIAKDLNINPSRYYKHFEQLKKYGYVLVEQKKEDGKFSNNEYILKQ